MKILIHFHPSYFVLYFHSMSVYKKKLTTSRENILDPIPHETPCHEAVCILKYVDGIATGQVVDEYHRFKIKSLLDNGYAPSPLKYLLPAKCISPFIALPKIFFNGLSDTS